MSVNLEVGGRMRGQGRSVRGEEVCTGRVEKRRPGRWKRDEVTAIREKDEEEAEEDQSTVLVNYAQRSV